MKATMKLTAETKMYTSIRRVFFAFRSTVNLIRSSLPLPMISYRFITKKSQQWNGSGQGLSSETFYASSNETVG